MPMIAEVHVEWRRGEGDGEGQASSEWLPCICTVCVCVCVCGGDRSGAALGHTYAQSRMCHGCSCTSTHRSTGVSRE